MESSVMREGDGGLLLPCDELNLEKFFHSVLLLSFTSHFALSFSSRPLCFPHVLVVFLLKDALPPLSLEVSYLFRDTVCYTDGSLHFDAY